MSDFGSRLREARERRGVSLRQIANATKISVSFLEALERNDISRLPGGIFSRAFVRSYAVEVGLDPETTIQDFIAQFPHDSVTAGHPTAEQAEDHEAVESNRRMATTFMRLALVSVPLAGAVVYFGIAGRAVTHRVPPPAPVSATAGSASLPSPEAASASTPSTAPSTAPPTAEAVAVSAAAAPGDVPSSDRLTVIVSVSRPSWLSATVDGEKAIERVLQPGDPRTMEVGRELVLKAGDAGAVSMTVNGAVARPLGKGGEVVTAHVTPSNFKEFLLVR